MRGMAVTIGAKSANRGDLDWSCCWVQGNFFRDMPGGTMSPQPAIVFAQHNELRARLPEFCSALDKCAVEYAGVQAFPFSWPPAVVRSSSAASAGEDIEEVCIAVTVASREK